ncbi:hypothetical protein [Phaeobacter sp. B1627]|uniref:hypothetical protein n=1 Tax=Phaeobacter sp. B1627 TaxID=2583809 RepID=UPI002103C1EA|nr:hypothetical protein [Phaeobacter sp. B1627]
MTEDITSTHDFVATTCLHLGRPCPAAERMLRALAGALDKARTVTREDFEITGESRLDGCEKACPARFAARHDRIRVYCDVAATTDMAALDRFADAMLAPEAPGAPGAPSGPKSGPESGALPGALPLALPDAPSRTMSGAPSCGRSSPLASTGFGSISMAVASAAELPRAFGEARPLAPAAIPLLRQ